MTDTPPAWDPEQYDRFESQRERAAHPLLVVARHSHSMVAGGLPLMS